MRFVAALLIALGLTMSVRADDFIVIVFDTSGSMAENMRSVGKNRMTVAQDALVGVLSKVPASTKIGVLTFEGWAYDLGSVKKDEIEKAIRSCRPGGGTPLYQYIKMGADRLLQERQRQNNVGYYKLLVVTDGEAGDSGLNSDGTYKDGTLRPGVLRDIVGRGIMVDAIGLDMRDDHSLKTKINGTYMRGDDPKSIEQSIQKAVAEVGFNGNDKIAEEAFREVGELPESFVKASILGLTTFQNQPIGEKPPVRVVLSDGTIIEQPDPESNSSGGMGVMGTILIVLGVAFGILVIFAVIVCRKG